MSPYPASQPVLPLERRRRRVSGRWLAAAALTLAGLAFVTLGPVEWRPHLSRDPDEERFAAFLLLGLACKLAFPRRQLSTLAAVVLLALGLEAAQMLIPGRHGRLPDAMWKAVGGVAGVLAGYASFKVRRAFRLSAARAAARKASSLSG